MVHSELAQRNLKLAAARHRITVSHRLRRQILALFARLPHPPARQADPNTILLIRPDHLGDVLLTTPAIRALRRSLPDARLIALCGAWSAEALAAYPEIDLVLTLPFPGFARGGARRSPWWPYVMAWRWAGKLRQLHASAAIVLRPDHWWGALLAFLAGVPRRIGYDLPDVRPFVNMRVPYTARHAVLENARLMERFTGALDAAALRLTFPVNDVDRTYINDLLAAQGTPIGSTSRLVVIHPGSSSAFKQWPAEHWALVADRLFDRLNAHIIFTGSDREHRTVWQIMDLMRRPAFSLVGETNLGQLAALFERASVALGPDTGPLHLAVAVGAPTVHLFGPADPELFGPWGDPRKHAVLTTAINCRPCRILDWSGDDPANHPCIREISVQRVYDAAGYVAR